MAVAAIALTGLIQRPSFSEGTLTPLPIRRRSIKLPLAVGGTPWRRRRKVVQPKKRNEQHAKKCVDSEFDLVLVPADGISMSGSDSDNMSDWSVGWFEPHHANFASENDLEDSFAVLVPCYGSPSPKSPLKADQQPPWAAALANLSKRANEENKRHLENWLASL